MKDYNPIINDRIDEVEEVEQLTEKDSHIKSNEK